MKFNTGRENYNIITKNFEDLGVTISKDLSWDNHLSITIVSSGRPFEVCRVS